MKMKFFPILLLPFCATQIAFAGNGNTDTTAPPCLVDKISIGTGLSADGTRYPYSTAEITTRDKYWRLTILPENDRIAAPTCAIILDSATVSADLWSEWIDLTSSLESRAIGYDQRPTSEGLGDDAADFWATYDFTLSPPGNPARFTRSFKIHGTEDVAVTFVMKGKADDYVFIRVDAAVGVPIVGDSADARNLYYDRFTNTSHDPFVIEKTIVLSPGIHTVDMDLYDAGGICSGLNVKGTISTEDKLLYANDCFGFSNDDQCTQIADTNVTALENLKLSGADLITIYPNPADAELSFDLSTPGSYTISIYNLQGQLIKSEKCKTNGNDKKSSVATGDLVPGNYILFIESDESRYFGKFTKVR